MTASDGPGSVLAGRRALITGGGSGLGRLFAEALHDAGADIVICGRRREVVAAAAAEIGSSGPGVQAIQADVTDQADVRRLAESAGRVDILVNNAGYSIRRDSWLEITPEEWREVVAINLDAPFAMAQAFVPPMMERGWGRVLNVASIYGVVPGNPAHYPDMLSDNTSYVASKHAVIGLTKQLAMRTASRGVTVNVLSPGLFPGFNRKSSASGQARGAETSARLLEATPMHRFGVADDLRDAVVFLAGPGSSFVTGQNIVVDGGFTVW